jgi:hypothetical protein
MEEEVELEDQVVLAVEEVAEEVAVPIGTLIITTIVIQVVVVVLLVRLGFLGQMDHLVKMVSLGLMVSRLPLGVSFGWLVP